MAKEHKGSNREAKKPKAAAKPAAAAKPSMLTSGSLTPIKPPKKAR